MDVHLEALITIALFLGCLAAVVAFRAREKLEIKNSDILLTLILAVLWLFLTGKIAKFTFGNLSVEAALQARIKPVPVESLQASPKGGAELLPQFVHNKINAISYTLGKNYYTAGSLRTYLDRLTRAPYLRFLVFDNSDGSFFCIADARALWSLLQTPDSSITAEGLVEWVKQTDKEQLATLPGFVSSDNALTADSDARSALESMNKLGRQTLPVVDRTRKFLGVVDRTELITRILIDISGASSRK